MVNHPDENSKDILILLIIMITLLSNDLLTTRGAVGAIIFPTLAPTDAIPSPTFLQLVKNSYIIRHCSKLIVYSLSATYTFNTVKGKTIAFRNCTFY